jgi:hypothetical protein
VALASAFFVLAGWPSTDVALSLVAVVIGLGATTPNPQHFTVLALVAAPIAAVVAATLKFLILDGATELPLLALALAPFIIGATIAKTLPNPIVAALGRLNLIFILILVSPSNPQFLRSERVPVLRVVLVRGDRAVARRATPRPACFGREASTLAARRGAP